MDVSELKELLENSPKAQWTDTTDDIEAVAIAIADQQGYSSHKGTGFKIGRITDVAAIAVHILEKRGWSKSAAARNALPVLLAELDTLRSALSEKEAECERLREALKPFADAADAYDPPEGDDDHLIWDTTLLVGDLRRARTALGAA